MEIPKYVQELIDRRFRLAIMLEETAYKLDNWLDANGIDVDADSYRTGVLIYTEPSAAKRVVEEAILSHQKM